MAGKQVGVSLGITAETGQAKKAINDLQRSIDNLSKSQINTNYLDKGINDAVAAAKELERHLSAALNQNTGKLNLNAFTQSLADSNISAKDLMQTLLQGGAAGQQTFTSLANAIAQSEVPLRRANKTLQDFATTLKNTVKWEISSTMVHSLESALSGAVSYAKNLNTSLTNIRIVTGQSVDDMARFAKEANVAAKALSTTTKSYADASLIYYQQGDSQEMAAKKAAITIKAANASFETSAKEMSEYLTSVWNSYQVGADELERYVDIMANLGAKTATSLEEIATSMQKVAATSNTVGVSMEQVSSIIATVSSVTRESAESIGTSYKTIFARIGDLKLGKIDEDGVGLGQVSSQLDAIGVRILDESGNLREMGDIITDLGTKWQTMNQAQKTAVAQVVAGKRQYTQLMALFENWDMYQQNINIAQNSEGALQNMADIYAESWEAASARVQASMEGIYNQILNDQAIITITNGLAEVINAVDTLIERLGGISGVLSTLGGIGINVFSKQIAGGINKTISSVKTYFSQFSGLGDFISKNHKGQVLNNEQINYEKSLADWNKIIDEVKTKRGEDSTEALALQNSRDLLDMKQQLVDAEYALSDAEKARAQQLITQQAAEKEHLLQLRYEREQLQKDLESDAKNLENSIVSAERGSGVASSVTRESLKQLGLEETVKQYTEKSKQSAYANSLESYYQNRRQDYNTRESERAAVEEIKKSLESKGIDAHIIDDLNDDLDTALAKVRQIHEQITSEADAMADDFLDKMEDAGFSQRSKNEVSKKFADITDSANNIVDIEFNEKGLLSTIENISKKFDSLFGKNSKLMQSFGDKLTAAAGTIASMQGGFESGASLIEVWNDEAAGFGDHLAVASGILTNLASGLAAGGIWGLIATGITTAIGIYSQWAEEQKKQYQEDQTKNLEKTAVEAEDKNATLTNIQSLIKNYNTLRETFDATGQGQEALAASALALADAYGLVGANVLIAEGRFGDFERMLAQHKGLNSVLSFYEDAYAQQREEINDPNKNSKYQFKGSNLSDHIVDTAFGSGQDYMQFLTNTNNGYLPEEVDKTAWLQWYGATKNEEGVYQYDYSQFMDVPNLTNAVLTRLNDETGLFNPWKKIFKAGTKGKDGSYTFDASGLKDVKSALDTMYKDGDEDYTAQNTAFAGFLARMGVNPSDAARFFNPQKFDQRMAEYVNARGSDSFTISETDFIAWRDSILGEEGIKLVEENYKKQVENVLSNLGIEYQDYITGLFDEDGNLMYNQSADKEAFYKDAKTKFEEIQKTKEILQNQMNSIEDKDSPEYEILQSYYEYLNGISITLKPLVEHKDISEGMKAMGEYQDSANRVKIINEEVIKLIGKTEASEDFGFSSFVDSVQAIYDSISETQTSWSELSEYFNEDGSVIQGKEKELEQAKKDLAYSFISDFTSLDDFLAIYKTINSMFDETQLPQVQSFIDIADIKDARLITSTLLTTMQNDLNNGVELIKDGALVEDTNTQKILAHNQATIAASDSRENYNSFINNVSKFKEDLSLDDSMALYELLIKDIDDGNNAWEAFVEMDYDSKKAYLEAREEIFLQGVKNAQLAEIDSAKTSLKDVYNLTDEQITGIMAGTDADFINRQTRVRSFSSAGYKKNDDGIYVDQDGQAYDAANYGNLSYEQMVTEADSVAGIMQLIGNMKNAGDVLEGIKLMEGSIPGLSTQMQTLIADFEQFNKTGRVSASVIKQLAAWGIDGSNIKTAKDYLKVMQSISNEAKKNAAVKKSEYDAMAKGATFDWSNEEVQKQNAELYVKWKEWQDLLQVQYDTEEQYNTAEKSYINQQIEKREILLEQMKQEKALKEEAASKTGAAAEAMSESIVSGSLTESQKLNMTEADITAWNDAANAAERGALAAGMWARYAQEMSVASEQSIADYEAAGKFYDEFLGKLDAAQLNNFITYDFQDKDSGQFEKYIENTITDDKVKAIWNQAFRELTASTDISNMSDIDIMKAVRDQIGHTSESMKADFDKIMAGAYDSIINSYATLGEQEAALARTVVEEWESTFRQIADLRRSILMGEDIGDSLTSSLDAYAQYAAAYNGPGSLAEAYKNGTLTAEQMDLGNSQELVDASLAAMGLKNDVYITVEGDDGLFHPEKSEDYYDLFFKKDGLQELKDLPSLAREFNISKDDFKDDEGVVNEAAYERAVREAAAPFIRTLLTQSGLDANTIDAKVNEFLNGSITATSTINDAANKMVGIAGEYADLLASNQKIAEADAAFQATKTEQEKVQQEAQSYADVTESIMNLSPIDKTVENIGNILTEAGISPENYLAQMRAQGFGEANSLSDVANMSYARLGEFESIMQQDAVEAGRIIVAAAETFKGIVTGEGFGEESVAMETANEYYETAQEGADILTEQERLDNIADYQTYNQMGVDQATNQLDSLAALDGMTAASDGWYQKIDDVAEAYKGLEGADAIIKKLRDGTIGLEEANDKLVDITLDCVDSVETLTDEQWDAYKQSLRTNKVTIDGYETLEDYIDTVEDARKEWKKFQKSMEDSPELLEDISKLAGDVVEEGDELTKIAERLGEDEGFQELWKSLDPENADIDPATIMNIFNKYLANMAAGMDETTAYYTAICDQAAAAIESGNESLALRLLASAGITAENAQAAIDQIRAALASGQDLGSYTWSGNVTVDGNVNASPLANKIRSVINALRLMGMTVSGNIESGVSQLGNIGGGGGGGRSSGGGGTGGGGGSKKKEKKEHKRYQDEIERYHKNNETLERISEKLDEIDALKDRTYGKKHVDQLDKETQALEDQLHAQQALHDEALKYAAADQINVVKYGAKFDADGTITNYEQVMRNIIDEYNRAVDAYNSSDQEDGDKEALEAAEQRYQDAIESIENYEEAIATANEAANEMLEIQNQISEIETEKITYILEYKIEMNERDLEKLEYYQDKYDDSLAHQGEVYAAIQGAMLEYESNLAAISEAMADLNQKRADGLINDADYAATLEELHEQIYENLGNLNEIQEELVDTYANTLSLATEEIEETTDAIESANEVLYSYIEIRKLIGEDDDHEKLMFLYDQMNRNNLAKIDVQKAHLNALIAEEDKFREKMRSDTYEMSDLEKEQYAALKEEIQDARDALVSSTQEALELVREIYEETINDIANELDAFMAGSAGSLAHLQEQYGYFQEEQGRYVSTAKELYEVSKLNRDIEGSLGDATSKSAKEALKALQEKINKQSELNELTEYDIEMNQLQYQLLLARIKLEETQNAKDVVRLTRDENGNYAYRYTANQDKIDEAAQNYEDILQQINDTTVQRTSEIENQMIETMAWGKEQMIAIANDYTLTEQEKRERLEELNNQFTAKMQYLHEQNNIATGNLTANQEAIAEHYGVSMSDIVSSTAGNVNETVQSMIDKTQEYIEAMNTAIFGKEGAQTAWQEYISSVGDIEAAADLAYGDMVESAEEMGEANQWSAEQAQEVISTLTSTLEPLDALTQAWNAHNAMLQETISYYETLGDTIQATLEAVGGITNTGFENPANNNSGETKAGTTVDEVLTAGLEDIMENVAIVGGAAVGITDTDIDALEMTEYISQIQDTSLKYQEMNTELLEHIAAAIKEIANTLLNNYNFTSQGFIGGLALPSTSEILEQDVHITAEFPSVTAQSEIEEALITLMNSTAQFANRKKS